MTATKPSFCGEPGEHRIPPVKARHKAGNRPNQIRSGALAPSTECVPCASRRPFSTRSAPGCPYPVVARKVALKRAGREMKGSRPSSRSAPRRFSSTTTRAPGSTSPRAKRRHLQVRHAHRGSELPRGHREVRRRSGAVAAENRHAGNPRARERVRATLHDVLESMAAQLFEKQQLQAQVGARARGYLARSRAWRRAGGAEAIPHRLFAQ